MGLKGMLLGLGLTHPLTAYASFDEGMAAYSAQNHVAALKEWRPLAEQGLALAQLNSSLSHSSCIQILLIEIP